MAYACNYGCSYTPCTGSKNCLVEISGFTNEEIKRTHACPNGRSDANVIRQAEELARRDIARRTKSPYNIAQRVSVSCLGRAASSGYAYALGSELPPPLTRRRSRSSHHRRVPTYGQFLTPPLWSTGRYVSSGPYTARPACW